MTQDIRALSLVDLAAAYRSGSLRPSDVTQAYLGATEVGPVYRIIMAERALAQAKRADDLFDRGVDIGPLQGIPIALKDLMDTTGEVTAAGSSARLDLPPADQDCPAAARLDAAGAVFLGKTTMTELAFSGIGINPHFGTPGCVFDASRVPGGSSSGSAVAVASQLACAAIGSDTGGSVRIPASFNGLVGLKTTDGDIPTDGCVALSTTLDTLGPIARNSEDAFHLWRALAGKDHAEFVPTSLAGQRFLAPTTVFQADLDPEVATAFERACARLRDLGATIDVAELPLLDEISALYQTYGSFAAHEALVIHEQLLEERLEHLDPRVSARILRHRDARASDYLKLVYGRQRIRREFDRATQPYDALLAPTVAILPPHIASLADDDAYFRANAACLRNTTLFNVLGQPAVSVPCATSRDGLSIGLMIATRAHSDSFTLALAHAVETSL
ncbi:MAG: amidase family protein [Trueperaceae bacterium]|nr:amidase family protein [Trueperaceae bacterium]